MSADPASGCGSIRPLNPLDLEGLNLLKQEDAFTLTWVQFELWCSLYSLTGGQSFGEPPGSQKNKSQRKNKLLLSPGSECVRVQHVGPRARVASGGLTRPHEWGHANPCVQTDTDDVDDHDDDKPAAQIKRQNDRQERAKKTGRS